MQADQGFELEVMHVVSLQGENCQAVERSQSVGLYPGDVVVAQLEDLHRRTMTQTGMRTTWYTRTRSFQQLVVYL